MDPKRRRIVLQQLGLTLEKFKPAKETPPPAKGWIRAIREALGMAGVQLAKRLNVAQSRITRLEHDEWAGRVTLKTMRQVAEAMDCVFVYAIVPRTSLEDTIRTRAEVIAQRRLSRTSHTMLLEDQSLQNDELQRMFASMVDDLVREVPRDLWRDK